MPADFFQGSAADPHRITLVAAESDKDIYHAHSAAASRVARPGQRKFRLDG